MARNQIPKEQATLLQSLTFLKNNVMANINCHNIGRILEFDPTTQTCTIELMAVKRYNEQRIVPAPITQVPLIIYGAGGGHITLPNPIGSICLLLFLDRNMDNFILTGAQYTPETARMHDFTDCVALTTFKTLANPLENYDEKAVSIFNEEVINEVLTGSYIKVYGNSIQLSANNQNGGASGVNMTLDNKVSISNTSQSLASLIQAFITACENITTVADESGGGLSAASKQAFEELKGQFQELLR